MTTLRCEELTVRLGRRMVLEDFSATFAPGELTVLVGPNGQTSEPAVKEYYLEYE